MTAYDLIIEKMKNEIEKSLDKEVADVLFRKLFKNECKKLDLIFDPYYTGGQSDFALKCNDNGVIEDIDLVKLKQFENQLM